MGSEGMQVVVGMIGAVDFWYDMTKTAPGPQQDAKRKALSPRVQQLTIAEIEPLVPKVVSTYFARENYDVVNNPKTRVFVDDAREFPALGMPYGPVAYPHWSAGVRRIVSLAYLLVWGWDEHRQAAALRQTKRTG